MGGRESYMKFSLRFLPREKIISFRLPSGQRVLNFISKYTIKLFTWLYHSRKQENFSRFTFYIQFIFCDETRKEKSPEITLIFF
jgi:hypothetical protein